MWKHYKSISLGIVAFASFTSFSSAQGSFPTSSVTPMPQAAQAGASAPTGGMFESNTFLEMANRVFDPSSDSLDFENGSFDWKGKSFKLSEQRAFRSRFERFGLFPEGCDQCAHFTAIVTDKSGELVTLCNDHADALNFNIQNFVYVF